MISQMRGGNPTVEGRRVTENRTVRLWIQLLGNKNIAVSANTTTLDELYALKEPGNYRDKGEEKMQTTTTVSNGKNAGITFAHLTAKAAEGKILAEDLVEIGKRKAQRLVRHGYEAGEDYLDESKRYIKHHPWQSVGVALGVGLSLGFLGGFLGRRN